MTTRELSWRPSADAICDRSLALYAATSCITTTKSSESVSLIRRGAAVGAAVVGGADVGDGLGLFGFRMIQEPEVGLGVVLAAVGAAVVLAAVGCGVVPAVVGGAVVLPVVGCGVGLSPHDPLPLPLPLPELGAGDGLRTIQEGGAVVGGAVVPPVVGGAVDGGLVEFLTSFTTIHEPGAALGEEDQDPEFEFEAEPAPEPEPDA